MNFKTKTQENKIENNDETKFECSPHFFAQCRVNIMSCLTDSELVYGMVNRYLSISVRTFTFFITQLRLSFVRTQPREIGRGGSLKEDLPSAYSCWAVHWPHIHISMVLPWPLVTDLRSTPRGHLSLLYVKEELSAYKGEGVFLLFER